MTQANRRSFLAGAAIGAAALTAPARLFAQAAPDPKTRRILEIASAEIERAGSALWKRDLAGIADFGVHSREKRFHFANLEAGTVRSFFVTHGAGSDPEHDGWLNRYSNVPESLMTSRGAYITWEWYKGRFGTSVRLGGLDPTNSNAFPRAIVMHPADYATQAHVDRWGRLGRSNGCFAMGPDDFPFALTQLSGGRLLFADSIGIGPDGGQISPPDGAAVPEERMPGPDDGVVPGPEGPAV